MTADPVARPPAVADVVVVGGGPAGLTAALASARRGRRVVLVESADVLGGMAASFEVAGQRVDLGSHRLHPSAPPAVAAFVRELLGDALQVRERNGRLHLAGRWVRFPLQAADVVRTVPPRIGARIAADLATGRWRRAGDDTYAEVVRAGLGPTVLEHFHGPMATKLWGVDAGELSGELARRRISVTSGGGLLRRIARTSRPAGRTFLYPRLGYGQVVDRLVDECVAAGVDLRTATTVQALRPGAAPAITLGDGTTIDAGRVLWTAPLPALLAAAGVAGTSAPLAHRGLVLVYLVVPEDRYGPIDAHYVPDHGVAFARLSEPKNYRDGPDPAGRTVLCAELPCTAGDATWALAPADAAALVLDGMARVGLRVPRVVDREVRRLPNVYPLLRRGEADRAADLRRADELDGVAVLGRQGRHVADNLHHVVDMALSAAACLGDDGWDDSRWRTARARFDTFVVDD